MKKLGVVVVVVVEVGWRARPEEDRPWTGQGDSLRRDPQEEKEPVGGIITCLE